jgi:hypothetical protein
MENISIKQLEEMEKELFKKQCNLDIQKAVVKMFLRKKLEDMGTILPSSTKRR